MAYELDLNDDLSSTARAAVRERLEKGAAVLREEHERDPVGAVHEARKEVKKSRSALRLVRPGLKESVYRRENRALRDAARTEVGAELTEALELVAGRVDDWHLDGAGWGVALEGISRAYKRGRKAFATAGSDPTAENLHELRKRAKDLWYQQRLLSPAWPAVLGAQANEAHELANLLGDDHDLAVLAERLRDDEPSAEDVDAILELIDRRREELLARIRTLGRRVYAEKPKAFERRLSGYMRSAEAAEPAPA